MEYTATCDCGCRFLLNEGINLETTATGDIIVECPSCRDVLCLTNSEMWEQVGEAMTQSMLDFLYEEERRENWDDFLGNDFRT
jgi:hypothetical protein